MEIISELRISTSDCNTLHDIVQLHPEYNLGDFLSLIRHIYKTDIRPGHYIYLGYLMSERVTTQNVTKNKNHFKLCLSSN